MLSMMFWNLRGHQVATWPHRTTTLLRSIVSCVTHLDVDLLMFAESAFASANVEAELTRCGRGTFRVAPSLHRRIQVFSRLAETDVIIRYDSLDGRLTVWRVLRARSELLLAVMHGHGKRHYDALEQTLLATDIRTNIERTEDAAGHRRTVLIGDLNMHPFDAGVAAAGALHAVMTRDLADRGERRVAGQKHRLFYNPMWGLFGDRTPGPPGSLFYSTGTPVNYYWHMVDQVLLRPELAASLTELAILDYDGQDSLVTATGRPRASDLSDHLPILCRLDV